jgi:hypothetical protein
MKMNFELFEDGVEYHNLEFTEDPHLNCFNILAYPFEGVLNPAKKSVIYLSVPWYAKDSVNLFMLSKNVVDKYPNIDFYFKVFQNEHSLGHFLKYENVRGTKTPIFWIYENGVKIYEKMGVIVREDDIHELLK